MNNLLYKRLTVAGIWFFSILLAVLVVLIVFCIIWYGVKKHKFGQLFKAFLSSLKKAFVNCGKFLFGGQKVRTIYQDESAIGSEELKVPEKQNDEKFEYKFAGWDKTNVTNKSKKPEPIFIRHVKKCYVNVYDEDRETLLKTFEVDYGAGVDLSGIVPIKESTKQFNYEFVGWDKSSRNITRNRNIYAIYRAIPIKFRYTFLKDNGKTVISSRNAIYGSPIIVPPNPVKQAKDGVYYEFVGWKNYKPGMTVTKDIKFIAEFKEVKQ